MSYRRPFVMVGEHDGAVPATPQPAVPVGIRGWLILPAIGTFMSPIYLTVALFNLLPTYEKLWTGRAVLSSSLRNFIVIEFIFNLAFIVGWIAAIFLLLSKSRHYPTAYIALTAGMVVFLAADMLISAGPFDHPPDQADVMSLVRAAMIAMIWCPYMLLSQRVRNTFVAKA
ncbi:MAG: DUF2569 domain-containing protein [Rhizomicrobium sp.]